MKRAMAAGGLDVAALVARPDDDADFFHLGGEGLFDQNAEDRFLVAVAIDQGL
jgi:hypothetical protein